MYQTPFMPDAPVVMSPFWSLTTHGFRDVLLHTDTPPQTSPLFLSNKRASDDWVSHPILLLDVYQKTGSIVAALTGDVCSFLSSENQGLDRLLSKLPSKLGRLLILYIETSNRIT